MRHDQLDLEQIDVDYLAQLLQSTIAKKTSANVKPTVLVEQGFVGRPTIKQKQLTVYLQVFGKDTGPFYGICNIRRILADGLDKVAEDIIQAYINDYIRGC